MTGLSAKSSTVPAPAVGSATDSTRDVNILLDMLRNTSAELARSTAELDLMAHAMSHDLREPLRMVTAYAQLLARRYQGRLDADADQFLHYIADGAQNMQALTEDLLDYSAVARRTLSRETCDSRAVLEAALSSLAPHMAEADADIQLGPMPVVLADAGLLTRLFANLVDNAIRYRHPGRRPEIQVSGSAIEGGWQFQVADNGESVPVGECDRIFMVFQRLHGSEKPGTGLGLAVCKRIVERHGGRIWVDTRPGQGTTFHFTLLRPI